MKIIVISAQVFPCPPIGYSGLEMIAWQCAKGLRERGHHVVLIAPDGSSCPGVEVFPSGPAGQIDEKTAYGKYWQNLPWADVVIDHSWGKWSMALKQEGRLPAPILNVMHAPINTMIQQLPAVDKPCFVCISQDQADHFQALFSRPARITYNGIDREYYKPIPMKRSDRFLCLGRFSAIKGFDLAIDACIRAGVGLDLIGDTSITNEPEFYHRVKAKCDGWQIRLIGPVNRGEAVWWFSQAHCLIHANMRFREPFGLAPVEAMACECPVIAWNYGAMRETIGDSLGGILVNNTEELFNAVSTAACSDWKEMRIAARKQSGRFSYDNMISGYETLCREAMQTGGW